MKRLEECYSRMLVDNHISDAGPVYMSRFDPEQYARMMQLGGAESAMVYACDHNGNCYYPTRCGHRHGNLAGRDLFGETVAALRQKDIVPVAYSTVIYHNDAARRFPEAGIVGPEGEGRHGRYRWVCPNHPEAVAFFQNQLAEIAAYEVAGIFIDMTFWPAVCRCDACRRKFGRPIPDVIDWDDPEWVAFQRFRETSMAEFAAALTATCRRVRPDLAVAHQFSPVLHGWLLGQSGGIAAASDYASGDFYGGKLQQRFAVKAFDAYSRKKPFEFMTSRCVNLYDHTSTKSDDELFFSALTTLANGGAYFFIDAIDPDGRLQEPFYRRLHEIQRRLKPFREAVEALRPELTAEVGIYFSMASCVDWNRNRTPLAGGREPTGNMALSSNPVLMEALGTAAILTRMHLPYRVLTGNEDEFTGLRAIVVNNMAFLSAVECERLRAFVRAGGTLIATGRSSLYDPDGRGSGNFALADVFGVDFTGQYSDRVTYFGDERIAAAGTAPLVHARPGTEVRGTVTLPDFPVDDPEQYASIHSNPPGQATGFAAVTVHGFGGGRCVYCATPFLALQQHSQQAYGEALLREFLPEFVTASPDLPGAVEVTLLRCQKPREWLLTVVNRQDELPPVPLRELKITFRLPFAAARAVRVSDGGEMAFRQDGANFTVTFDRLDAGEFLHLWAR